MKKNVLILDECKAMCFMFKTMLSKNYSVSEVSNSFFAMQELASGTVYELLILNVNAVPSENFEFLQHISTSSLYKKIPVIIISSSSDKTLKDKFLLMNVLSVFEKPFDPIKIIQCIQDELHKVDHIQFKQKTNFFNFDKVAIF
jgi:PleD family two-component response regulator